MNQSKNLTNAVKAVLHHEDGSKSEICLTLPNSDNWPTYLLDPSEIAGAYVSNYVTHLSKRILWITGYDILIGKIDEAGVFHNSPIRYPHHKLPKRQPKEVFAGRTTIEKVLAKLY